MSPQPRKRSLSAKRSTKQGPSFNARSDAGMPNGLLNGLDASNGRMAEQIQAGALTGLDATEAALSMYRTWFDISRQMIRAQQDSMFNAWRSQLAGSAYPNYASPRTEQDAPSAPEIFEAAAKAYGHFGDAVLQAQREAFETLTQPTH